MDKERCITIMEILIEVNFKMTYSTDKEK